MFPVEAKIGEVRRALSENRQVVLCAPPGSGKTTAVPPALLDVKWLGGRKIVMLEPRRLAARNCAAYIASRLGEAVGGTVGYQVRLERKVSRDTRLEIVTEGLLAQRFLSDPELSGTGLVIFDEFHERSIACDLAFAMALDVRNSIRPDLRIMVMSATLDAQEVASHLENPTVVCAEGRLHPVATRYLGDVSMFAAVNKALSETDGDILCFLPGEGEIKRVAARFAEEGGIDAAVLPLYGALPAAEQDAVFLPSAKRKVILATSIAETSLTIPGIGCVIDSGLMRASRFSPNTGMSALVTLPLSLDRAEQRRGRAGRVRDGVCYRLWEESAEAARPRRMTPEILDADLCPLVLSCVAWGVTNREGLPWLTPPADSAWRQSVELLKELGALGPQGLLTAKGRKMARLAMHPRLANMLIEGGPDAAILAAIIEEGAKMRITDIRRVADYVRETTDKPYSQRVLRLARKFVSALGPSAARERLSEGALLALAYPERIAKNRGNGTFRMISGRGAMLEREDPLAKSPYLVCCDLDDRQGDAKIFLCAPVDEREIEDLFRERIVEETVNTWDRQNDRVKSAIQRRLGGLVLKETAVPPESSSAAIIEGIRSKGLENMPCWTKEALGLKNRLAFLARHCGWPEIGDETVLDALAPFVDGFSKWRDLEKLDLSAVYDSIVSGFGKTRRELDRLAPTRMEVPSGSRILVHYDGAEPTVEVRLQECFGLMQTPMVAGGKVPVVLVLLSPAHRPIQITKDLAGFWREGYALVRKDMRGRYPKHYWPEDPFSAVPTSRTVKR